MVFSDWLLSLSSMYLIFLSVFPWLDNSFVSLLNKIPCLDEIWLICPFTYGRTSWANVDKVVIDICVQVLCECMFSTLDKYQGA